MGERARCATNAVSDHDAGEGWLIWFALGGDTGGDHAGRTLGQEHLSVASEGQAFRAVMDLTVDDRAEVAPNGPDGSSPVRRRTPIGVSTHRLGRHRRRRWEVS